jgi:hypothetical protein
MFKLLADKKESSRLQINIKGLSKNVLILPNDDYRVVLKVSSINFELRSEAEQDATIDNYQVFLNSLPCPIQILFRVRQLELGDYLTGFKMRINSEKKAIYKKQINSYTAFVKELVADNRILSRNFYLVVPYTATKDEQIESVQEKLNLYAGIIGEGLNKMGIKSFRLTSLEILDLFYSFYSPEKSKSQTITEQTLQLINQAYL